MKRFGPIDDIQFVDSYFKVTMMDDEQTKRILRMLTSDTIKITHFLKTMEFGASPKLLSKKPDINLENIMRLDLSDSFDSTEVCEQFITNVLTRVNMPILDILYFEKNSLVSVDALLDGNFNFSPRIVSFRNNLLRTKGKSLTEKTSVNKKLMKLDLSHNKFKRKTNQGSSFSVCIKGVETCCIVIE